MCVICTWLPIRRSLSWVIPEKIHTPPTDGILEILTEGGAKTLEIQAGGGVELEKSLLQGSFQPIVHAIRTFSSVTLKRSQTLKIVEIFCLHISHLT